MSVLEPPLFHLAGETSAKKYTGALTFENVWQEAVEGSGYFDTIKECYQQSVRWQWGAVDVGYLLVQSVSKWDVPILKRLHLLFTAYDHHLLVVVMCISLTAAPWLYGDIPVMVDLDVLTGNQNLLALKDVMVWVWAIHFSFHYCFLCYTDYQLRTTVLKDRMYFDMDAEEHPSMGGWRRCLALLLFPIADFWLFVLPTVHAHTKMLISSSFNYVPSAKQGARPPKNSAAPSPDSPPLLSKSSSASDSSGRLSSASTEGIDAPTPRSSHMGYERV